MPACHRCDRVQATAEVRRTRLGWLCKENSRGTRCWTIARELAVAVRRERRAHGREALTPTRRAESSVA
jgi:hypothetical protein